MSEPSVAAEADVDVKSQSQTREETRTQQLPPYHVILLNDEDHSFAYVIEMLIKLFRHPVNKAVELTWKIHNEGRAIVYTTHRELAELKRDQVHAYGPDPRSARSHGPIRCRIEPA